LFFIHLLQVVLRGFMNISVPTWVRRLLTRGAAVLPAALLQALGGDRLSYRWVGWQAALEVGGVAVPHGIAACAGCACLAALLRAGAVTECHSCLWYRGLHSCQPAGAVKAGPGGGGGEDVCIEEVGMLQHAASVLTWCHAFKDTSSPRQFFGHDIVQPLCAALSDGTCRCRFLLMAQVVLALQLPFVLVPLIKATSSKRLMGPHRNSTLLAAAAWGSCGLVFVANLGLFISELWPGAALVPDVPLEGAPRQSPLPSHGKGGGGGAEIRCVTVARHSPSARYS
jgi:hypothetical protein